MSVQTINEKIELINTYKNNIKNAIVAKGVAVADNEKLENYASKIALIEQNSGGGTTSGYTFEDALVHNRFPSTVHYDGSTVRSCAFAFTNVENVYLPNISSVRRLTFAGCYFLKYLYLPSVTSTDSNCFSYCSRLTQIDVPNLEVLASSAFYGCYILSKIDLPKCSNISATAFQYCYNLTSLTLGSNSVCKIANSAIFSSTPFRGYWNPSYASSINGTYGSIYVPMSLVDAYKTSTNWTYYSSRIVGY